MKPKDLQNFRQLPLKDQAAVTRELWIGFVCACLAMGVFGLFNWWFGWIGDPHHCAVVWDANGPTGQIRDIHECYCEDFDVNDVFAQRPGIRQWANTLSNLVPLVTGLVLALQSGKDRFDETLQDDHIENSWGWHYPLIFVLVVGFMGPGSMFLHASITEWGGYVDNASMFLFVWFLFAYGAYVRVSTHQPSIQRLVFLGLFLGGVSGSLLLLTTTNLYIEGKGFWLLAPAAFYALAELWLQLSGRKVRTLWFWLAAATFAAALGMWSASIMFGDTLCSADGWLTPKSYVQAHALWHILANFTAVFLFLHFRGTDTLLTPTCGEPGCEDDEPGEPPVEGPAP